MRTNRRIHRFASVSRGGTIRLGSLAAGVNRRKRASGDEGLAGYCQNALLRRWWPLSFAVTEAAYRLGERQAVQVADCYVHVRYQRLREQDFQDLRERLLGVAIELAPSVKRGQDLDFRFEE